MINPLFPAYPGWRGQDSNGKYRKAADRFTSGHKPLRLTTAIVLAFQWFTNQMLSRSNNKYGQLKFKITLFKRKNHTGCHCDPGLIKSIAVYHPIPRYSSFKPKTIHSHICWLNCRFVYAQFLTFSNVSSPSLSAKIIVFVCLDKGTL